MSRIASLAGVQRFLETLQSSHLLTLGACEMRRDYWLTAALWSVLNAVVSNADELPLALTSKGLATVGNQLVIAEEAVLANVMKNLKSIQGKYLAAYRTAYQAEDKIHLQFEEYDAGRKLQQQLIKQSIATRNRTNEAAMLEQRLRELSAALTNERQDTDEPFSKLAEARKRYIEIIHAASEAAEAGAKRYRELTTDQEVTKAMEELNKSAPKPFGLGPTRSFTANATDAAKCRGFIRTDNIPLRVKDGIVEVDVSVDRMKSIPFRLAPEAATSRMRAESWLQELNYKFGDRALPYLQLPSKSNENGIMSASYVPTQSIRVGEFEVQDSIIACFGPSGEITDNQLGLPFFRNFDWKINTDSQMLTLTEVNDPAAKKPRKKKK